MMPSADARRRGRTVKIRGEDVPLPTSMIGGYPRPHWLQGRVFGSLQEPLYRSSAIRVAYEDAVRLCAQDQERAGFDILADGQQYFDWEAPGVQLEPIFHYITEMLEGFRPWGPPNPVAKYSAFYMAECVGKVQRTRSLFEGILVAMQHATTKPFKIAFLGPSQNSVIVHDLHYNDNKALAMDLAVALNEELRYLQSRGLEAIQIIDVLPPYTQEHWQIDILNRLVEGLDDVIKFWHICYGSVDGQTDVWEDKAADMMPLFADADVTAIHFESAHRDFRELDAYRKFPEDKVLGLGFIDVKDTNVEKPEAVADNIKRVLHAGVVPPERLLVMPDCGLGYCSRSVASAKLKAIGEGVQMVREEL
jgi:5-methyltetrahydropteroyltriglutamate--homocysteine methyltransferase